MSQKLSTGIRPQTALTEEVRIGFVSHRPRLPPTKLALLPALTMSIQVSTYKLVPSSIDIMPLVNPDNHTSG